MGTNRIIQFRYQVIGIAMGAVLAVVLAKTFMNAFPVLKEDQFQNQHIPGTEKWQAAMTFKFVGALNGITKKKPEMMKALRLGLIIGLATEIARKQILGAAKVVPIVASRLGDDAGLLGAAMTAFAGLADT